MTVRLVVGAPAAGKTTYVRARAAAGDTVLDWDDFVRITGSPTAASIARKAVENAAKDLTGDVWIIRTLADAKERTDAARRVGADEVIVLTTPQGVAEERSRQRGDDPTKASVIQDWWEKYTPAEGEQEIAPAMGKSRQGERRKEMANRFSKRSQEEEERSTDGGNGFPANTAVKDMSHEEQAAYWKHKARKHETRAKSVDDLEEERESIRRAAVAEFLVEKSPGMVHEAFRSRAKGIPEEFLNAYLEDLDTSQYLDDDLQVDTEAISERLESFGSFSGSSAHGGFRRHTSASGVEAGAQMYSNDKKK